MTLADPWADEYRETFARALRTVRLERGLSQYRLSKVVGLSVNHVLRLENGQRSPTRAAVEQIINGLALPKHEGDWLRLAAGFAPRYDLPIRSRMEKRSDGYRSKNTVQPRIVSDDSEWQPVSRSEVAAGMAS